MIQCFLSFFIKLYFCMIQVVVKQANMRHFMDKRKDQHLVSQLRRRLDTTF